jgi:hypothetical protein
MKLLAFTQSLIRQVVPRACDLDCGILIGSVTTHLSDLPHGRSYVVPRTHPQSHPIKGELRRELVKIRPAIQMASANSNSGDETRRREEDNKANSGVCCALGLSAVAKLRARDVKH